MANNSQYTGATIEATANGRIEIGKVTGTTSSGGDLALNATATLGSIIVLSAWSDTSGTIVMPYAASGGTAYERGNNYWWFHVVGDDAATTVKANTNLTIYFAFVKV